MVPFSNRIVGEFYFTIYSPRLYNVTKSYDKSHFEQLQRIIDNPVTPKEAAFFYTEASELGLIGNMFSDIKVPYHRIDTVRYKGMTKQERYQATCSAGLAVVFSTNSSAISIRTKWGKLKSGSSSNLLSYKGYDLYIKDKSGNWKWAGTRATLGNVRGGTVRAAIASLDTTSSLAQRMLQQSHSTPR